MRCQALDNKGKRCRNTSTNPVEYFGSPEHYGSWTNNPEPVWVTVLLCNKHRRSK